MYLQVFVISGCLILNSLCSPQPDGRSSLNAGDLHGRQYQKTDEDPTRHPPYHPEADDVTWRSYHPHHTQGGIREPNLRRAPKIHRRYRGQCQICHNSFGPNSFGPQIQSETHQNHPVTHHTKTVTHQTHHVTQPVYSPSNYQPVTQDQPVSHHSQTVTHQKHLVSQPVIQPPPTHQPVMYEDEFVSSASSEASSDEEHFSGNFKNKKSYRFDLGGILTGLKKSASLLVPGIGSYKSQTGVVSDGHLFNTQKSIDTGLIKGNFGLEIL